MPVVNPLARELVFKIVYYGPGLGGKTTTLQHIHATTRAEHRGKMVSLATPVDRTLYFDFLPIRLPTARSMGVRLQLFTVPGQVYYNATRRLVLTGADAIVFVADSQRARLDANLESLANLNENLREHGRQLHQVPHVIAYNKRDLPEVVSIEELASQLDKHSAPSFATCATSGEGVYETLDGIARAVLEEFERQNPAGHELVPRELQLPEGGLTEALKGLEPKQPLLAEVATTDRYEGGSGLPSAPKEVAGAPAADETESVGSAPGQEPAASNLFDAGAAPTSVDGLSQSPEDELVMPKARPSSSAFSNRGVSFRALWPEHEHEQVLELESALHGGRHADAVKISDELVSRALAGVASALGSTSDAPRDPALVVLLLGLDGRRYLAFRSLVRESRSAGDIQESDALSAFAFAIEARLARARFL